MSLVATHNCIKFDGWWIPVNLDHLPPSVAEELVCRINQADQDKALLAKELPIEQQHIDQAKQLIASISVAAEACRDQAENFYQKINSACDKARAVLN